MTRKGSGSVLEVARAWRTVGTGLLITEGPVTVSEFKVSKPEKAVAALTGIFGKDWPHRPDSLVAGPPAVAALAPGEWAIFERSRGISERIGKACEGLTHLLVDVSAGRRAWSVAGPRAREIIAKGCTLDTRGWAADRCAQSLLAQIPVLLLPLVDARTGIGGFSIIADASHALYLRDWFQDAASEFNG
jgi:sarcosine oxidase subunit gamma